MMLYTCVGCQHGQHDLCAGKQSPPPGMLGGSECDCDGSCDSRKPTPDPQLAALTAPEEAYLAALTEPSAERSLADLLSSCKQWRQATESRLRLVTNREMSDSLLAPDKALFEAIDKAEQTREEGAR